MSYTVKIVTGCRIVKKVKVKKLEKLVSMFEKESCVLLFSSIPSRAPPARVLTSYRFPSTGPMSSPMRC